MVVLHTLEVLHILKIDRHFGNLPFLYKPLFEFHRSRVKGTFTDRSHAMCNITIVKVEDQRHHDWYIKMRGPSIEKETSPIAELTCIEIKVYETTTQMKFPQTGF